MLRIACVPMICLLLACVGCADLARKSEPAPVVTASVTTASAEPLHWLRDSSEYRAVALTTYRAAADALSALPDQCGATKPARPWIVVMDADETLLDNSLYQLQQLVAGAQWSAASWNAWVARQRETLVPGALGFVRAVAAKCARIAVVTNRRNKVDDPGFVDECEITRARLRELFRGVEPYPIAAVLCADAQGDKNARFKRIAAGEVSGLGAVDVAMYVGDSITDFPDFKSCNAPAAIDAARFGAKPELDRTGNVVAPSYFQLPNPLYGGWTHCTPRAVVDDLPSR